MIALFWFLMGSWVQAMEVQENTRHAITSGISVPHPLLLGYEWEAAPLSQFHFYAEGGYFRIPMSGNLKSISVWGGEVGARFFPFQNGWFCSGSLGFRQIGLSTDISGLKLDGVALANNADLTLNAAIFSLGLGRQWFLSSKVALSAELGMQLPIPGLHGGKTSIVQDVPDGSDLGVDDSDALYRITTIPVPKIALIRFIWYID